MGSVADIKIDDKTDQALDQLDDEKSFGLMLSEYSRTIIDRPENFLKFDNSISGAAISLQNTVILRELRLWCCRIWEKNGNSLPSVAAKLTFFSANIVATRRLAHPDWDEKFLQADQLAARIELFQQKVDQVGKKPVLEALRVTRDEHFAHLLKGTSGARKKLQTENKDLGYTYNEVLALVDQTICLIAEAIFIWQFRSHSDADTRKTLRKHYERYWELLPVFSELESTERELKISKQMSR